MLIQHLVFVNKGVEPYPRAVPHMTDMDIAPTRLAVHQLCKLVASDRITAYTAQQFTDMTKDLLGSHEDAPIVLGGARRQAAAHAPDGAEASIGIYGSWGGQPAH